MPETLEQRRRRDRVANGEYPYYLDEYHAFSDLVRMLLEFFAWLFSANNPGTPCATATAATAAAPAPQPSAEVSTVPPTRFPFAAAPTNTVPTMGVVDAVTPAPLFTPTKPNF